MRTWAHGSSTVISKSPIFAETYDICWIFATIAVASNFGGNITFREVSGIWSRRWKSTAFFILQWVWPRQTRQLL